MLTFVKFPGFSWPSGGNHSDPVPLQQRGPRQNSKGMDQKIRDMKNFPCNNVNSQHLVNWDVFNNLNIKWSILRFTWTQRKNPLSRRLGLLISLLLFFSNAFKFALGRKIRRILLFFSFFIFFELYFALRPRSHLLRKRTKNSALLVSFSHRVRSLS